MVAPYQRKGSKRNGHSPALYIENREASALRLLG